MRNGKPEYLVKRKGTNDTTWELEDSIQDYKELISVFEIEKQRNKMKEDRKRRGSKKNKLEEIQKPRGYDRGLQIQKIVGCTDCTGELMLLVKWHGCDEMDLLHASEVNENDPEFVIKFYESRCPLVQRAQERKDLCKLDDNEHKLSNLTVAEEITATQEENIQLHESENVTETLNDNLETDFPYESTPDINSYIDMDVSGSIQQTPQEEAHQDLYLGVNNDNF